MRLIRFLRRLRVTIAVHGFGERSLGLGYHLPHGGSSRWAPGGENGLLMLDFWIAHSEWNDPENDPRKGPAT